VLDTVGNDSEMNGAEGFVEKVANALRWASHSALMNNASDFCIGFAVGHLAYAKNPQHHNNYIYKYTTSRLGGHVYVPSIVSHPPQK
jgi:hypothetical protein